MSHSLFDLTGRVAAVIGGGSGIGEAVAHGLRAAGAIVAVFDNRAEAAERVAAALSAAAGPGESGDSAEQPTASTLDIRDSDAVDRSLDELHARRGRLDIVVCTPSINVRKTIVEYTGDEFDRVVAVNLKGSFNVLRTSGRIMSAQGRGSIVMFSSIRSQVVEPGQSVYAMTKAGIVQLVRTGAAEFGQFGVRVNAVAPGVVETPLTAPIKAQAEWYNAYADKSAMKRWARAEEMVGPTLFLASDGASYVTGSVLFADGGWTAVDGRYSPPGM
jgi:NAD(P)-dependent dehydrogenase (short-subunit alcohol dehydrogenase family)